MSSTARKLELVTADEYLEQEIASPVRHEFVNGVIYAMAGGSDRHGLIALNLASFLSNRLPDSCDVFVANMKLRIRKRKSELFYYPDVLVSCSKSDRAEYHRERPILLAEVLSPTTERIDRIEKLAAYKRLSSLAEYLIVEQDIARVEIYRRSTDWTREVLERKDTLVLECLELELPVADLYRRVRL